MNKPFYSIVLVDTINLDIPYINSVPVEYTLVDSISELYTRLCDSTFIADMVIIDIDKLTGVVGSDTFDIINTIMTLINAKSPATKVVVSAGLTVNSKVLRDVLGMNIRGICPKGETFTAEDIVTALTEIVNDTRYVPKKIKDILYSNKKRKVESIELTPRQSQILTIIKERGASNKVIAKLLNLSESTVKLHISHIFKKFGVRNRTQLALFTNAEVL